MKLFIFILFFPVFALAQCNMDYQVVPSSVPLTLINGAINAKDRLDNSQVVCMEVFKKDMACAKYKMAVNGAMNITSHQQFKVRSLKRYIRDMVQLMPGDALAVNGVIIENLNMRIAEGSLREWQEIWLPKPIKVGKEMVDRVYVLWTEKRL
jgi:hypothetical protein